MAILSILAIGILVALAAVGIVPMAAIKGASSKNLSSKVAEYGLVLGGVILMYASIAGWFDNTMLFGGLLMVLFGTGLHDRPAGVSGSATSTAPAHRPDA